MWFLKFGVDSVFCFGYVRERGDDSCCRDEREACVSVAIRPVVYCGWCCRLGGSAPLLFVFSTYGFVPCVWVPTVMAFGVCQRETVAVAMFARLWMPFPASLMYVAVSHGHSTASQELPNPSNSLSLSLSIGHGLCPPAPVFS